MTNRLSAHRRGICFAGAALLIACAAPTSAGQQPRRAPAENPQAPVVTVGGQAKLTAIKAAAIFMTGDDALRTRFLQDALATELMRRHVPVIEHTRVEKALLDELNRRTPPATDPARPSQPAAETSQTEGGLPNVIELAKALGADAVVTGAIVERVLRTEDVERRESTLERRRVTDHVLVTAASLQAFEVRSGQVLFTVALGFEAGISMLDCAVALAQAFEAARTQAAGTR